MSNSNELLTVKTLCLHNEQNILSGKISRLASEHIRQLCFDLGADDVGFIEIDRKGIADQRNDILQVFPSAKTLISFVCRINRENLRSPARSVANLELHHVNRRIDEISHKIAASLEKRGIRALTPAAGFPMETEHWPEKMWVVSHKPIAVEAGLGRIGLHRCVIHPKFGSFILLGTVLINAEMDTYNNPLSFHPCIHCKLCAAACPTGAIESDGYFNFINCMTHNYRDGIGGFTDWVEKIVESKNFPGYRMKVDDSETVSRWQSMSVVLCNKSVYCMAVCPAGEDVAEQFLTNREDFIKEVVKPLQEREEPVYVLFGSDAEEYVSRTYPHKKIKHVGNTIRPSSIKAFLRLLPLAFQRHKAEGLTATYHFTFTGDEDIATTIIIANKTIAVQNGHIGAADICIQANSKAWLRVLNKESTMLKEIIFRRVKIHGPIRLLKAFGRCFT